MNKPLYVPYKTIGVVTDGNPYSIQYLGNERFLTTSIGNCFQIFRIDQLTSCLVSQSIGGDNKINSFTSIGHETYVASRNKIYVFHRTNVFHVYHEFNGNIEGIIAIGTYIVAYDDENRIVVIDKKLKCKISEIKVIRKAKISCLVHPSTYLNKFLVGFDDGALELWNFNSRKMIYSFHSHVHQIEKDEILKKFINLDDNSDDEDTEKAESKSKRIKMDVDLISSYGITCLEQSPACDVVAIGFSNGYIVLINLKLDKVLFSFASKKTVTSITFRTDSLSSKFPYMVSSDADGALYVWNLSDTIEGEQPEDINEGDRNGRKLLFTMDEAHTRSITKVSFLYGEPIMISASLDNSIKVWIFDAPNGSARLLKSREGHSGTPVRIRYYGGVTNVSLRDGVEATSCEIVSAGSDGTIRLFNTTLENQNREFSQKVILQKLDHKSTHMKRLPECIGFDVCETRARDWGNMVTIHRDHFHGYVWKYQHRVGTEMVLSLLLPNAVASTHERFVSNSSYKQIPDKSLYPSAVCISPCGNYCVIGYRGGYLQRYNLQSGLMRGSYPKTRQPNVPGRDKLVRDNRESTPANIFFDKGLVQSPVDNKLSNEPSVEHDAEVTGIFIDMMNELMVSIGLDGKIIFWNFLNHSVIHFHDLLSPQMKLQSFRDANFVAVVDLKRIIRVFDVSTFKLARRFDAGHSREVTDLAFTPDGRKLLSSSTDGTVRVWDMPTGRCLSWMKFSGPIKSIAISLTGEFLNVTIEEKEGIFMFLDRSMYETVHYWKDPTSPANVADSSVKMDDEALSSEKVSNAVASVEESGAIDGQTIPGDNGADPSTLTVNKQAETESIAQRGDGTITISTLPKAYWTTIFHLEAIKMRNQPVAPPIAPIAAPFFIPTVIKNGSTPSFPTPEEYKALLNKSPKPTVPLPKAPEEPLPKEDVVEMPDFKSVWNDDTEAVDFTMDSGKNIYQSIEWFIDRDQVDHFKGDDTAVDPLQTEQSLITKTKTSKATSRILHRNVSLPRCKLAGWIRNEFSFIQSDNPFTTDDLQTSYQLQKILDQYHLQQFTTDPDAPSILSNLMKLSPPAVDLEIRALCNGPEDLEGLLLLRCFIAWMSSNLSKNNLFELFQAYLHRILFIYSDLILQLDPLQSDVMQLASVHEEGCQSLRDLIHKNLCVLKVLANIPIN